MTMERPFRIHHGNSFIFFRGAALYVTISYKRHFLIFSCDVTPKAGPEPKFTLLIFVQSNMDLKISDLK